MVVTLEQLNTRFEEFWRRFVPTSGRGSHSSFSGHTVKFEVGTAQCEVTVQLDEQKVHVYWGTTQRTALQAQAALILYKEATDFAILCQNFLDDFQISA